MITLLASCFSHCQAQFVNIVPDCCTQAINLNTKVNELEGRLANARTILDSTRAVTERIINMGDERMLELERLANETLKAQVVLRAQAEAKAATMQGENERWVPRTKFGKLWHGKAVPALATVGGISLAILTFRLAL